MNYVNKSFSVQLGGEKAYRDNWERVFGKQSRQRAEAESAMNAFEPSILGSKPSATPTYVHLRTHEKRTACGTGTLDPRTWDKSQVTCPRCKKI